MEEKLQKKKKENEREKKKKKRTKFGKLILKKIRSYLLHDLFM